MGTSKFQCRNDDGDEEKDSFFSFLVYWVLGWIFPPKGY